MSNKRPSEGFLTHWEAQAQASFQEIDQLSAGIRRIYELLGNTKRFTVSCNPAHKELKIIIAQLEEKKSSCPSD